MQEDNSRKEWEAALFYLDWMEQEKISVQIKRGQEEKNIYCFYPSTDKYKMATISNYEHCPFTGKSEIINQVIRFYEELGKVRRAKGLM